MKRYISFTTSLLIFQTVIFIEIGTISINSRWFLSQVSKTILYLFSSKINKVVLVKRFQYNLQSYRKINIWLQLKSPTLVAHLYGKLIINCRTYYISAISDISDISYKNLLYLSNSVISNLDIISGIPKFILLRLFSSGDSTLVLDWPRSLFESLPPHRSWTETVTSNAWIPYIAPAEYLTSSLIEQSTSVIQM